MSPILPTQNDHPGDASEDEVGTSEAPQHVIANGDSDSGSYSDEESPSHDGYELLSQDPDNISNITETDNYEDSGIHSHIGAEAGDINSSSVIRSLFSEVAKVTDEEEAKASAQNLPSRGENKGYSMDEEHIEKIKAAMKGFTLPSANVPAWASVVPEEEWKMQIFTFLESRVPENNVTCSNTKSKCDCPCTSREPDKSFKGDKANHD